MDVVPDVLVIALLLRCALLVMSSRLFAAHIATELARAAMALGANSTAHSALSSEVFESEQLTMWAMPLGQAPVLASCVLCAAAAVGSFLRVAL